MQCSSIKWSYGEGEEHSILVLDTLSALDYIHVSDMEMTDRVCPR